MSFHPSRATQYGIVALHFVALTAPHGYTSQAKILFEMYGLAAGYLFNIALSQAIVNPINSGVRLARSVLVRMTSPILQLGRFSPEKWILTTYADGSLVVARDNCGGLVVLERD